MIPKEWMPASEAVAHLERFREHGLTLINQVGETLRAKLPADAWPAAEAHLARLRETTHLECEEAIANVLKNANRPHERN